MALQPDLQKASGRLQRRFMQVRQHPPPPSDPPMMALMGGEGANLGLQPGQERSIHEQQRLTF